MAEHFAFHGTVGYVPVRNYIIVVHSNDCRVERLIESPFEDTIDKNQMYDALANTWSQFVQSYPLPRYDIIAARGNLASVRSALPECTGWHIRPEPLQMLPGR